MIVHVSVPSAPVSTSTHPKFKTVALGAVVSGIVTNRMVGVQSGAVLASVKMHNVKNTTLYVREQIENRKMA